MNIDDIKPKKAPRIIDLIKEVGLDTNDWFYKKDGTPSAIPASNPQYCYDWCYWDADKKLALINLWYDEINEGPNYLSHSLNMRYLAENDSDSNRRRRAAAMDALLREVYRGGWTLRAIILEHKLDRNGKSTAKKRLLDPNPWYIDSYESDTGECIVVRKEIEGVPEGESQRKWSREELKESVEAYLMMRDAEQRGEVIVKADVYRELAERLGRTAKSFEFRMQNISHVLAQQGRDWIRGLKPAKNVGINVTKVLEQLIAEVEKTAPNNQASFQTEVNTRIKTVKAPPSGTQSPKQTLTTSTSYSRDAGVVAWVLNEANGLCEACGTTGPFERTDGTAYLEVHHVVRLADNGPDTVDNAVALCPNCHRALHHAADKYERRDALYARVSRLKRPRL